MSIKILLEGGRQLYYPGTPIQGKVVLDVTEPIKYRSIFILFKGYGYVTWKSGRTRYRSNYECFNLKVSLLDGPLEGQMIPGQQGDSCVLAPNIYEFPFSFRVPLGRIPSSYEDHGGIFDDKEAYVRYWLEARVYRPWRFDMKSTYPITIRELVDLNRGIHNRPCRSNLEKTICCLCCASAPVIVDAVINRTGFCCREPIVLTVHVNNTSSRTMRGVVIKLMRHVVYTCRSQTNNLLDCLVRKVSDREIGPGTPFDWSDVSLTVPQGLLPSSTSCPFITIKYYVAVEVITPSFSMNASIRFPITIGNVPIESQSSHRGAEVGVDLARVPDVGPEEPHVTDKTPLLS